MIAVTSLKHCIHLRLSSLCPPTSNILEYKKNFLYHMGHDARKPLQVWSKSIQPFTSWSADTKLRQGRQYRQTGFTPKTMFSHPLGWSALLLFTCNKVMFPCHAKDGLIPQCTYSKIMDTSMLQYRDQTCFSMH